MGRGWNKLKNYLLLILGMAIVTYLPRLIPLVFLSSKEVSLKMKRFLLYIPYTSLSILIIRGIITSSSNLKIATAVGIFISGLVSYSKGNLVVSVLMGIGAAFITINFLG